MVSYEDALNGKCTQSGFVSMKYLNPEKTLAVVRSSIAIALRRREIFDSFFSQPLCDTLKKKAGCRGVYETAN
jgi:hypothetical protein